MKMRRFFVLLLQSLENVGLVILMLINKVIKFYKQKTSPTFNCTICYYEIEQEQRFCFFCSICVSCLDRWFSEQIKRQIEDPTNDQSIAYISCPSCRRGVSLDKIFRHQQQFKQTMIHISDLHIKKDQAFVVCPSKKCKNVGWINSKNCIEDYNCSNCDLKWRDQQQQSFFQQFILGFSISELMTRFFKFCFTKTCPHCDAPIQKNGGCNNMTCGYCNKQFCWYCKVSYYHSLTIFCPIIAICRFLISFLFPFRYIFYLQKLWRYLLSCFTSIFSFQLLIFQFGLLSLLARSVGALEKQLNYFISFSNNKPK